MYGEVVKKSVEDLRAFSHDLFNTVDKIVVFSSSSDFLSFAYTESGKCSEDQWTLFQYDVLYVPRDDDAEGTMGSITEVEEVGEKGKLGG